MKSAFYLGKWRVEPHRNALVDGVREVKIEPRAMQLLVYLADHAGATVTKEAILRDVWDGVFVTDEALTYSIWEARKALGDDARRPEFIQTVPRKGYRLIAPVSEPSAPNPVAPRPGAPRWSTNRRILGLLAAAFAASIAWVAFRGGTEPPQATRAHLMPPPAAEGALDYAELALSPDGGSAAWVARREDGERILWVQSLRTSEGKPLPGTEGAEFPFWSPDGRSLGFFAEAKLKRVETATGSSRELCAAAFPWGGAWSRDGFILFAVEGSGIEKVNDGGGEPENVVRPEGPTEQHRWPSWLPDGRHFLNLELDERSPDEGRIVLRALEGGETKTILEAHSRAEYAPPGYVVHLHGPSLMAQRLDRDRRSLVGEPRVLAESVREVQGHAAFSLSPTGLLAYQPAATDGVEAPAFRLLDWKRALSTAPAR
ncbi:MAG: winged helix-turn-helix domain-containing protein [Vicinamibacteria bacterium]